MTPRADPDRLDRLNALLRHASAGSPFQRARLGDAPALGALDELATLPFTTKDDLLADQAAHPPFGTNLTYPLERYTHLHQTSGTTGQTLRVLDTTEDWAWWSHLFAGVLANAGVVSADIVAMAYSFGPYVQFWGSYAGAQEAGTMVLPLGGMDSLQRLQTIREYAATVLLCTPSYAVHLAQVAVEHDVTEALESVTRIVCTGEPGASMPALREQIAQAWGASVHDHAGLSEVGSFARPCPTHGGMHLAEEAFVCELLDPADGSLLAAHGGDGVDAESVTGELVVTALGRLGWPAIRYRTGDVVEARAACPDAGKPGHDGRWLPHGILGRTDDMVVVRGMNVFPSAIEQILREADGVGEFRITFYNDPRAMDEVKVEVELAQPAQARAIQASLRQRLGLRVRIVPLRPGILPPQVGKARRVEDLRPGRAAAAAGVGLCDAAQGS